MTSFAFWPGVSSNTSENPNNTLRRNLCFSSPLKDLFSSGAMGGLGGPRAPSVAMGGLGGPRAPVAPWGGGPRAPSGAMGGPRASSGAMGDWGDLVPQWRHGGTSCPSGATGELEGPRAPSGATGELGGPRAPSGATGSHVPIVLGNV